MRLRATASAECSFGGDPGIYARLGQDFEPQGRPVPIEVAFHCLVEPIHHRATTSSAPEKSSSMPGASSTSRSTIAR